MIRFDQLTPIDKRDLEAVLRKICDQLPTFVDPDAIDSDIISEVAIELKDMKIIRRIINEPVPYPLP